MLNESTNELSYIQCHIFPCASRFIILIVKGDFPFTVIHNPMIADSHSMGYNYPNTESGFQVLQMAFRHTQPTCLHNILFSVFQNQADCQVV